MFVEEHFYSDMSVKFDKFLKTNLENIGTLSLAGIFSNDVNWRRCELPWSSFSTGLRNFG